MSLTDRSLTAQVRNWRYTFWVNFFDLALYWGGDSFASVAIVLPLFVSRLTDFPPIVGLVTALYWIGFVVPQLITAGYVRRKRLKKPFAVWSFAVQRLSLFLIAGAALALGDSRPDALLVAFLLFYTLGCLGTGAGVPAQQDVIAKVVPVESRGRLRGWGMFAASLIGVGGGFLARHIIATLPFPSNFALCFAIAGLLGTVSLAFVAANREPAAVVVAGSPSLRGYLRRLPGVLAADANFRRFIYSRVVFSLAGMAVPFLPIYVLARFELPDHELGALTTVLMAGQTVAVLLLGFVGDRFGHKLVLQVGGASLGAGLGLALLAQVPEAGVAAFALVGCSNAALQIAGVYIVLEFAPPEDRPTYIALSSTLTAPTTVVAPLLGGWVAALLGYPLLLGLSLVPTVIGFLALTLTVREPRHAPARGAFGLSGP